MIKKFLLSFLLCFIIVISALLLSVYIMVKITPAQESVPSNTLVETGEETESSSANLMDQILQVPKKTNFLIIGLDQTESLADVILVGSFDSQVGSIDMMSLPRDTRITLENDFIADMKSNGYYPPRTMRLNALHSYAKDQGAEYTKSYIEDSLGISIDYMVEINTEAFRYIVDAVGGIEFQVRDKGYHYNDPYQDLTIDIDGGLQILNGKQAEGLVRYRHDYALADIERIDVQHEFMKAFFEQVLSRDNIIKNAPEIISTIYQYVSTDFPLSDVPKYLPYVSILDSSKFNLTTLPGHLVEGSPYYIPNTLEIQEEVNSIFYNTNADFTTDGINKAKIQVLNGSRVANLASETKEKLEAAGYNVANIGNSTDALREETVIYTNDDFDVSELYKYFKQPVHEINETAGFYDITIVLGTSEDENNEE
ncbi:MAG: LCP family protein [Lachnospirales bacterium]